MSLSVGGPLDMEWSIYTLHIDGEHVSSWTVMPQIYRSLYTVEKGKDGLWSSTGHQSWNVSTTYRMAGVEYLSCGYLKVS